MNNETKYSGTINIEKCKQLNVIIDRETQKTMTLYELSRWRSLMEAVSIIDEKLDTNDANTNWIKPIAIQRYVDERTDSMLFEISNENNYHQVFEECTTL